MTFHDTDKKFELNVDLLQMITNKNYNIHMANSLDKKWMKFDEKALAIESARDKILIRLLEAPAIILGSLKKILFSKPVETKTRFSSSNPNEFSDRK